MANGAVALAGTLAVNNSGTFATGTAFDLVQVATLTGTFAGIVDGGFYTSGSQTFEAQYTSTDFVLVAVSEPATWLAGALTLLLGIRLRGRRVRRV